MPGTGLPGTGSARGPVRFGVTVRRGSKGKGGRGRKIRRPKVHKGILIAVGRGGGALRFQINPTSVSVSGGVGGWNQIERPRRRMALEHGSISPMTVSFELVFDGWPDQAVEKKCSQLRKMGEPTRKGYPPPAIRFIYGNTGLNKLWVVDTLDWSDEIRNPSLQRVRQVVGVGLMEYVAAEVTMGHADRFRQKGGGGGGGGS